MEPETGSAETWPKEFVIRDDLSILVGFADAHVAVEYDTAIPFVGRIRLRVESDELELVREVLIKATKWAEHWHGTDAPWNDPSETRLSPKVIVRVGFRDLRVEIKVKVPVIGMRRIAVPWLAVPVAESAIEAALAWRGRSEVERFLLGAE